jgi:anti-sigma B factor antagonist
MLVKTEQIGEVIVAHVFSDALDAGNAKEFRSQIAPFIVPGVKLLFDLEKLKFVDSSGLGALLSCLRQVHAVKGEMKLCGMAKPVHALFELVRMHRVFDILITRDEALRSYELAPAGVKDMP